MFSSFTTRDRLRRSMSTRSMRRAHPPPETESVDTEVAKSHAATAAARAMRLSERSSIESRGSYDRLGGPSNVAIPRRRQNTSLQSTDDGQSVIASSITTPMTPQQPERNFAAQTHHENPAVLPPITEFKGLDGRDSSVPSSYRRLRKAKSMFSTRQRLPHLAHGKLPMPHGSSPGPDFSPEFAMPRTLRNSTSFVRGNYQVPRAIRHAKSQDGAIQLARSQYLEENGSPELQNRRSSFLLSRRKREHRPFRKTFRTPSDASGPDPSPGSFGSRLSHGRSRTLSASIKHGLKRVFGLSRHAEQAAEQPTKPPDELGLQDLAENVTNHDDVSLANYPAEIHYSVESSPLRVIQTSPIRASLYTTDSRKTSQTTSVAPTVTTRRTGHRQSLSLVEEDGAPNEDLSEIPADDTTSRLSPSRKRSSTRNVNGWFNTQDLYTALMQQIGRNAAQNQEEVVLGTVPEHRVIPERASSNYSHRSLRTVRRVSSEESTTSPESFATARGDSMSPQKCKRSVGYIRPLRVDSWVKPGQENTRPRSSYSRGKSPHSAGIVGGDSDEDTGSVIFAHSGSMTERVSPTSVYSRTTGGDTPTKNASGLPAPDVGEPGIATIFASERTAWSSPSHLSRSRPSMSTVQPSADWQQWMSSQIERIENASSKREHFREDAQFQDEDEIFTDILRQTPLPGQVFTSPLPMTGGPDKSPQFLAGPILPQSNYSRPFSRSSSVRTILSAPKIEPEQATKVTANNDINLTIHQVPAVPSWSNGVAESPVSPMRIRTSNMIQIPESPTPPQRNGPVAMKRAWTQEQFRRYSARRPMTNGKSNSFRSMRSQRDIQGPNNENVRQGEEHDEMMDEYHQLQDIHSTISSKRMVDIFLDSRRRQMGMESPVSENNAPDEAFI